MLIDNDRLIRALNNFDIRNDLMKELNSTPESSAHYLYRRALAFWLGSNITLIPIQKSLAFTQPATTYIYIGYYCLLKLDTQISLEKDLATFKILRRCRQQIVCAYNLNFQLLVNDPKKLFLMFQEKINDTLSDVEKLQELKKQCCNELNRLSFFSACPDNQPLKQTSGRASSLSKFSHELFQIFITQSISIISQHYFFNITSQLDPGYDIHKFFIPAEDGMILEGLLVKEKQKPTKTLVLALIGHHALEDIYVSSHIIHFQKLFASDIVFINHRNFAKRSGKLAKNTYEIANDVTAFAKYFQPKNRKLILYGMCGGAAHMTISANTLMQCNIPFKLIVDRFFCSYPAIFNYDAFTRKRSEVKLLLPPLNNTISSLLRISDLSLIHTLIYLGLTYLFNLTNNNPDFAQLIRNLPAEDVLILQAKAPKRDKKEDIFLRDTFIHPNNDIRKATKTRRVIQKGILKNLIFYCDDINAAISNSLEAETWLQMIFQEFQDHFKRFLKLINNEKLTIPEQKIFPTDLHPIYLDELTTRHQMPINTFLHGFFTKPKRPCDLYLNALKTHSAEEIFEALNKTYRCEKQKELFTLAEIMSGFLSDIDMNKKLITHLGNRLSASISGHHLSSTLRCLFETDFFKNLAGRELHKAFRLT